MKLYLTRSVEGDRINKCIAPRGWQYVCKVYQKLFNVVRAYMLFDIISKAFVLCLEIIQLLCAFLQVRFEGESMGFKPENAGVQSFELRFDRSSYQRCEFEIEAEWVHIPLGSSAVPDFGTFLTFSPTCFCPVVLRSHLIFERRHA